MPIKAKHDDDHHDWFIIFLLRAMDWRIYTSNNSEEGRSFRAIDPDIIILNLDT
jgi:hypothetical protein